MVSPLVGALIVIVVALLGARFSFSTERVPQGPRLLLRTGTHFLAIGFLLGPVGLDLVTPEAGRQLFPVVAVGLGWVGLHFGLQLDRRSLAHFPLRFHAFAIGQAAVALLAFLGGAWVILFAAGVSGQVPLALLLGAACTAAVTTPAGIAIVSANFDVRGPVRDLLYFVGSLDAVVGIVALQITYALLPPSPDGTATGALPGALVVGVAVGLGLACGALLLWLLRARPSGEEVILYLLGTCALAAGSALQWGLSPLFVSLTVGALLANVGRDGERVLRVLERWEKPVYLSFLLIAGALLRIPTPWIVALSGAYAALRVVAKALGGAAAAVLVPADPRPPLRVGLGLIPQGGVSLAMAVSLTLVYPPTEVLGVDAGSALFTVVVLGVVVSELTGPLLTLSLLRRAGEASPWPHGPSAGGGEEGAAPTPTADGGGA